MFQSSAGDEKKERLPASKGWLRPRRGSIFSCQTFLSNTSATSQAGCLVILLLFGTIALVFTLAAWRMVMPWSSLVASSPDVSPATAYRGNQYWKNGVTQAVRTLWETPFARFQIHTVKINEQTTIDDWLWFDECDNVNILVQAASDNNFLVLQQTKYAIPGETYAVIGGLIELERDRNDALSAAKRELQEELGMESDHWKSLGNFVAAANRGGGKTHVFWAQNAKPISDSGPRKVDVRGIAEGELERQDVIRLSRDELLQALLNGRFREIKWTATVALALLQQK